MIKKSLAYLVVLGSILTSTVYATNYEWQPLAKRGSNSGGIPVTGRVVPQDGALYIESARIQGHILSVVKREGESVLSGTILYSISSPECLSLIEERRVATSKDLSELVRGLDSREKQLGLKIREGECFLIASHAGVLTKRNLEAGAAFNLGDQLGTIVDVRKLTVEVEVSERDQTKVKPGQKVHFQFSSHPEESYTGEIQNTVPTIDPLTRTAKARLKPMQLPKNIGLEALIFGAVDAGPGELTFEVPNTALVFFHNKQYLIVGSADDPRAVQVSVLNESDRKATVRSERENALVEGASVATKGAIFLLHKMSDKLVP